MTPVTNASPSISISIPAYNEEAALPALLRATQHVLEDTTPDWEILIINDGSKDRTGAIADEFARGDSRVRVVHHAENKGFGTTLKEVYTLPSKEWVFFIPGDGQIEPNQLAPLLAKRHEADVVIGWRVDRQDAPSRKLNAAVYNTLVSLVLGRRIHDVDSVVFFRQDIAHRFQLRSQSVFLHAEFLMKAARSGARWMEVPIRHRPRQGGQALGCKPKVIWQTFSELVRFALKGEPTA